MRVTVGLLLLWMTTTAVVLAFAVEVQRQRLEEVGLHSYGSSPYQRRLWLLDMLWFAFAPAYGAALAAAASSAGRLASGTRGFPQHPGHWIGVLLGIATLGYLTQCVAHWLLPTDKLATAATLGVLCVVSCLAANSTRQLWRWKVPLLLNAIGMCVLLPILLAGQTAGMSALAKGMVPLYFLPGVLIGVAALAALVVASLDILTRNRFDLFHWLGLLLLCLLGMHPLISLYLVYR